MLSQSNLFLFLFLIWHPLKRLVVLTLKVISLDQDFRVFESSACLSHVLPLSALLEQKQSFQITSLLKVSLLEEILNFFGSILLHFENF